ncbi:hypothetical protein Q3G72_022401 [Acer saccharum]|nr:hypothetical protein Q3G72_022401 [Acer saccharum]
MEVEDQATNPPPASHSSPADTEELRFDEEDHSLNNRDLSLLRRRSEASTTPIVVNAFEFHLDEPKSRSLSLVRIHTSQTPITTSSSFSSSTTIIHRPKPHPISAVVESHHPDSISSAEHNLGFGSGRG